jgi:hypothetical protein
MSNEKTVRQIFDFILSLDERQFKIAKDFMNQLELESVKLTEESAKPAVLSPGTLVEWTGQLGDKFTGSVVNLVTEDIYNVRISSCSDGKFPIGGSCVHVRRKHLRLLA